MLGALRLVMGIGQLRMRWPVNLLKLIGLMMYAKALDEINKEARNAQSVRLTGAGLPVIDTSMNHYGA